MQYSVDADFGHSLLQYLWLEDQDHLSAGIYTSFYLYCRQWQSGDNS